MLYNVGSKNEQPEKTGLAHLFEHLMFGGTENINSFDGILEEAGGSSNAFTSSDITNYYITIPKQNLETAFWLESDRMASLELSQKSINTQKAVVIEEFKQRYLNQPYGDVWHLLRPLAYTNHPYSWPTIGKEISQITNMPDQEFISFFNQFYTPGNAILSVAGNLDPDEIFQMAEKWFGQIKREYIMGISIPPEPAQLSERALTVERQVPQNAVYIGFHCPGRKDSGFYTADLLSDMLCGSESAYIYRELVKNKQIFSELDTFLTGDTETGLLVFAGKVPDGIQVDRAVEALKSEILHYLSGNQIQGDLEKVKHKTETAISYSGLKALDKAMNLAFFENLSEASQVNNEMNLYNNITKNDLLNQANCILNDNNGSILYYLKGGKH